MSNSSYLHIPRLGGTKLIQDYISNSEELKEFITDFPSKESVLNVARSRNFPAEHREKLFETIDHQYIRAEMKVPESWRLIRESNCFTVTTGHQLNLFGGPKYFIYKIISVLKLVNELNESQSEIQFLPIFWMATEDHDFEEINEVRVYGNSISTKESKNGPVGRHDPILFEEAFIELKNILGTSTEAGELIKMFEVAFQKQNWSDFTRYWVDQIFDGQVIIVDGDDARLKELFVPIIKRELKERVTDKLVSESNEKLEELGYHVQVNHRDVNLFYVEDGIRERIGIINDQYKVHNLPKSLELTDVVNNPEKISPNALLRPVYQEAILPNTAYIGGAGELAYWFQLKALFDELTVSFPILILRDSYLFIKKEDLELLASLGMTLNDLEQREDDLLKAYINKNDLKRVQFENELDELNKIIESLKKKVSGMHRDYHQMIEAERARIVKFIGKLELRATRDAKFREEVNIRKILLLRQKYFPGGGLVERTSSFMEEYILLGKREYLQTLINLSDVMDGRIKVIAVNK